MELKKFRRIAGFSQEELAARSGVDKGAISRLERGLRREPSYETVVRLARALNLEPEELVPVDLKAGGVRKRRRAVTEEVA